MPLSKGDVRDGLRRAAETGPWESAKELFAIVSTDPRLKSLNFWEFLRQFRKDESELSALRDAAAATRGSNRRGYVPPEMDCPGRHWATPFVTWDDGFTCDLCSAVISVGATCLGCQLCNHDVCPACVNRLRDTTKGTGATRALTSLGVQAPVHEAGVSSLVASDMRSRRRKKKGVPESGTPVEMATAACKEEMDREHDLSCFGFAESDSANDKHTSGAKDGLNTKLESEGPNQEDIANLHDARTLMTSGGEPHVVQPVTQSTLGDQFWIDVPVGDSDDDDDL